MALLSSLIPSRKKIILIVAALTLFLLVFDSYYSKVIVKDFDLTKHIIRLHNQIFNNEKSYIIIVNENQSLIDTPGCVLPRTDLLPKGFSMKKNYRPYCLFEKRIVTIDDTKEILSLTNEVRDHPELRCTVLEVIRNPRKDTFAYGSGFKITDKLDISDKELFATKCGQYINFDAHFPVKKEIQEKINHWKEKQQPPINVLFMGFDTVSRLHFHRSLEKTLPLMTQMGFKDFQGFHSIVPYTLENFLAFLTGMKTTEIRATCAASWTTPFDKCPLIWKAFDLNKFITMYIEDGSQSFNWGGQSGFIKKPTDYYPHPIFGSVKYYRQLLNKKQSDSCLSTMNAPKFLLDYTKRFLKKFKNSPFFSFTWFANPFHDSTYSLYAFDERLHHFFQFLNSNESKELRERTLIILNSDHGERHGAFMDTGYEGFIERALPGLFIRLPENLVKLFPEVNLTDTLKFNSEQRLTSGFDIHHTLLHLLKLQGLQLPEDKKHKGNSSTELEGEIEFEPVLKDRSSLFLPVSDQRTCQDINVFKDHCVCSRRSKASTSSNYKIDNALISNKLIHFAIDELNAVVKNSKYKDVCEMHGKPMLSFLSSNVIDESDTFTDTVLRFITDLDKAQFEVQLRIVHENSTMDHMQRLGSFNRLNLYGNNSWCVEFVTDEDKRMKEVCHCKERKPQK